LIEKKLTIGLPEEMHSDLKLIAVLEKVTMKEIIIGCIAKYIQDYEEEKKKETKE
jgi:hypothetical protein